MLPCGSDVLLRNVVFVYGEIWSNATCKNLLYLPISILSLQHYDVFDVEGWVVGVAVSANRFSIVYKSAGQPKGIWTTNAYCNCLQSYME